MLDLRGFGALAIGLVALAAVGSRSRTGWIALAAPYAREAGIIVALYVIWQLMLDAIVTRVAGAAANGMWVWRLERTMHLPSERSVQRLVIHHPLVLQASNGYYSGLHFPALIACLVWVFARHRDRYRPLRTTLIALTALCAVVQAIPVAPPRLLPGLGLVDTGVLYRQSDYTGLGLRDPGQVVSMPSVHVGWALLVAVAVVLISRSPWRWLALVYPVATTLVVVVTANHFWLDGVVAGAILALVLAAEAAANRGIARAAVGVAPAPPSPAPSGPYAGMAATVGGAGRGRPR